MTYTKECFNKKEDCWTTMVRRQTFGLCWCVSFWCVFINWYLCFFTLFPLSTWWQSTKGMKCLVKHMKKKDFQFQVCNREPYHCKPLCWWKLTGQYIYVHVPHWHAVRAIYIYVSFYGLVVMSTHLSFQNTACTIPNPLFQENWPNP